MKFLGTALPGFLSYIPFIDFFFFVVFFVLYKGQRTTMHGMVGVL